MGGFTRYLRRSRVFFRSYRRITSARSGEEEEMRTIIGRSRKITRREEEKRKSRGWEREKTRGREQEESRKRQHLAKQEEDERKKNTKLNKKSAGKEEEREEVEKEPQKTPREQQSRRHKERIHKWTTEGGARKGLALAPLYMISLCSFRNFLTLEGHYVSSSSTC